jgi:hypothetical protein
MLISTVQCGVTIEIVMFYNEGFVQLPTIGMLAGTNFVSPPWARVVSRQDGNRLCRHRASLLCRSTKSSGRYNHTRKAPFINFIAVAGLQRY